MLIFVEHLTTGGRSTSCVIARIIVINGSIIGSPAAVKLIHSAYAIKRIITIIATQNVIARPTINRIITIATTQDIVSVTSPDYFECYFVLLDVYGFS